MVGLFCLVLNFLEDEFAKSHQVEAQKKLQMQGAQILRNEAYIDVRRNDEGCSATQQMDFLRSRLRN